MPWEIKRRSGKFCVIKIEDGSTEKCHDTETEAANHMRALYASENKAMATSARNILESKIHQSFTVTADELFGRGYIDREQRIGLSGLIGQMLETFGNEAGNMLETVIVSDSDVLDIATKEMSLVDKLSKLVQFWKKGDEIPEKDGGLYTFKDHAGDWWLLGVVTNNRMDREAETLTANSHRYFVNAIESGEYKEKMGHDMPELWIYHIPVPVGDAHMVAYDERGFIITAIKQRAGEFYTKVFEGLASSEDLHGMSHGMPNPYVKKEKGNDGLSYVTQYLSKEFTALPLKRAANFLTSSMLAIKELYGDMFEISEEKRKYLVDTFGSDMADQFDQRVKVLEIAADAAGIPKKEFNMAEDLEKEALDDQETAGQPKSEVKDQEPVTADKAKKPPFPPDEDDEDEEDGKKKKPGKKEQALPDPQYMTHTDAQAMVDEIVKGVTDAFVAVTERMDGLEKQISDYREEEDRIKKQVELTPWAGLAGQLSKSVVGREETKIDGRKKEFQGPVETDPGPTGGGIGIASIDRTIQSQRSGARRAIPAFVPNGQRE